MWPTWVSTCSWSQSCHGSHELLGPVGAEGGQPTGPAGSKKADLSKGTHARTPPCLGCLSIAQRFRGVYQPHCGLWRRHEYTPAPPTGGRKYIARGCQGCLYGRPLEKNRFLYKGCQPVVVVVVVVKKTHFVWDMVSLVGGSIAESRSFLGFSQWRDLRAPPLRACSGRREPSRLCP